jgi:beta-lactam-binding protein with PASTA domain
MIDRGSAIDLVVGKSGSGEMTLVPDLRGVSLAQAQNELTILNLSLGAVIYDESVLNIGDSLSARVWQQRPEASGQVVDQGISVDLWMTADESKINAGQPDGAGVEQDNGVIEW